MSIRKDINYNDEIFPYDYVISVGFKDRGNDIDPVFLKQYGFHNRQIVMKLSKKVVMEWDIITHEIKAYREHKEGEFRIMVIADRELLESLISFFKK